MRSELPTFIRRCGSTGSKNLAHAGVGRKFEGLPRQQHCNVSSGPQSRRVVASMKPLLDNLLATSARVGSLIIPAGSLASFLGRSAMQLTVWTHHEVYKVNIPGSATGIIHGGRSLLGCSMHQLKNVELSDVGIMLPDGSRLITSSGSRTFRAGEHLKDSDAYDVAAFDFTEPAAEFS